MRNLARLVAHPTDPDVVILKISHESNTLMGRFEAAQLVPEHGGYLVHTSLVDSLTRFLGYASIHLTDDRGAPTGSGGVSPAMPECRHCGQPAKAGSRPAHCPDCGQPWQPVYIQPTGAHGEHVTQTCPRCDHTQRGQFAYCSECGEPIPPAGPAKPHTAPPRPHLADPMPLADTIAETADRLAARPSADAGVGASDEPPW